MHGMITVFIFVSILQNKIRVSPIRLNVVGTSNKFGIYIKPIFGFLENHDARFATPTWIQTRAKTIISSNENWTKVQ